MKLWIDDVRPCPDPKEWRTAKTVNEAKRIILRNESIVKNNNAPQFAISIIDIDHDAGNFVSDGGDYIKLLDWLEETGRNYPIHIHSMNPVGVENMRRIIKRNGWKEV
jgi:hypothetical protein